MNSGQKAMLELFGRPEVRDASDVEVPEVLYGLKCTELLDAIDWMLASPEIFLKFTPGQIGQALDILYNMTASDFADAYLHDDLTETRQVAAVKNLRLLYDNYFEKLCPAKISEIGGVSEDPIEFVCYMFWDFSVIQPPDLTEAAIIAGIDVMMHALNSANQSCVCSALHGLGHWKQYRPKIKGKIRVWLQGRKDLPKFMKDYAWQASEGNIM